MTEPTSPKYPAPVATRVQVPGIVFIGGVHGVGKTTFSRRLSQEMNVPTYSAGTLIGHYSASERRNGKTVANVTENQNLLLLAVATLKVDSPFILLDGHFCVRDPLGKIQKIPADTYTSLSVKAVIVLREETSVIEANLYSRDGVRHSQQEISALQNAELDYAGEITSKMNIPLKVLGNSNLAEAIFFIRNAMVSLCEL